MSQRLPTHPYLSDPFTGEPLRALASFPGLIVWPSMGGESEEEGQEQNDDEQSESYSEGEEKDSEQTISRAEYERVLARMKAADRRASELDSKVKKFESEGQTEAQRLQSEREEAVKRAEQAEKALRDQRIANAFLSSSQFNWHDPMDALTMLQSRYMDSVEIDDDGRVKGMTEAVKKMAKEKSYLVKQQSSSSTSDSMNGGRRGDDRANQKTKDDELARRMPALARVRPTR
jgi:hypothetical protein